LIALSRDEDTSMSPRSMIKLVSIALIAACGFAEAGWARTGARTGAQAWPDQTQLKAQIEQCHLTKPPEGIAAEQARAATLDYESQCYRQLAEMEHARREALQDAVSRSRAHKLADQTLLERESLPTCRSSKPIEAIPEGDRRMATLDYENQCYRQLAEIERGKLEALQEATRHIAQPLNLKHRIRHGRVVRRQPFTTYFQATR
jgi:hypothetical protein